MSIHDRGFLYGDGLFEAVRVYEGKPFLWKDHIARFQYGCEVLKLRCPFSGGETLRIVEETIARNRLTDALIRITLSRGSGPRGYSPAGADYPTFLVVPFQAPAVRASYKVIVSSVKLMAKDPISYFKHANKLHQILARAEADEAGADEALLTNTDGFVVEGTTTNLFWVNEGAVWTPPLEGILPGTTRAHVLRLCGKFGLKGFEREIRVEELLNVEGLFVTSCAAEITPVSHVNGKPTRQSPIVARLRQRYRTESGASKV